jgi:hypothetical protein
MACHYLSKRRLRRREADRQVRGAPQQAVGRPPRRRWRALWRRARPLGRRPGGSGSRGTVSACKAPDRSHATAGRPQAFRRAIDEVVGKVATEEAAKLDRQSPS